MNGRHNILIPQNYDSEKYRVLGDYYTLTPPQMIKSLLKVC